MNTQAIKRNGQRVELGQHKGYVALASPKKSAWGSSKADYSGLELTTAYSTVEWPLATVATVNGQSWRLWDSVKKSSKAAAYWQLTLFVDDLDHETRLYRQNIATDGLSLPEVGQDPYLIIKSRLKPNSDSEKSQYALLQRVPPSHRLTMEWPSEAVAIGDLAIVDGRYFEVLSTKNLNEQSRFLRLNVAESLPPAG